MSSRTLPGLVALASSLLGPSGCDYYVPGTSTADYGPTIVNPAADAGADVVDASAAPADAGDVALSPISRSPLCGMSPTPAVAAASACDPDSPTTVQACDLGPDAAETSANAAPACRLQAADAAASSVAPACVAAGPGGDGSWCKTSSECAASYDCVGAGTCQHYCCGGNTECVTSEFCDVQPTTQTPDLVVPVCMPIQSCNLLAQPSSCPQGQTCSVVRENGLTGCVAIGTQQVGEPCDQAHCAAGLACLGTPGERECYQLCHTANPSECASSQQTTCTGGLPLFPDPSVGICQ